MGDESAKLSGAHLRNFLIILAIPIIAAIAIAWRAQLFRSTPKVAIVTSTEDVYWDRVINGAQNGAKMFGMDLTVVRCKADEKLQSDAIRDLLSRGYDGIAVSPVNAVTQRDLLREVADKSVLVTFDSDCEDSNRKVFIGTDNYIAGRGCGDAIKDTIPDGGEVIIAVGSVEKANGRDRRQGLIDCLLNRPIDPKRAPEPMDAPIKGDKYTILTTLIDGVDAAKATSLATEAIAKYPNVKCFAGLFGYSTPALLEALKQTNKLGAIKVVAFDEAEATLAGMEKGYVSATLLQDQFGMGYDTIRFFNESLGKLPPSLGVGMHMQYLGCRTIPAESVDIIRYEQEREAKGATTQEAK